MPNPEHEEFQKAMEQLADGPSPPPQLEGDDMSEDERLDTLRGIKHLQEELSLKDASDDELEERLGRLRAIQHLEKELDLEAISDEDLDERLRKLQEIRSLEREDA
jgi:hypothetical protein